jgi:hypothetical protein
MRGEGNLCIYHEEVDIGRDRDSERLLQPENFEWRAVNEGVCRRLLDVDGHGLLWFSRDHRSSGGGDGSR